MILNALLFFAVQFQYTILIFRESKTFKIHLYLLLYAKITTDSR